MTTERNPQGHTPDLLLTRADESVKSLKVKFSRTPGQFTIENCAGIFGSEFETYYTNLSGYCGHVNPHTFASAPELLAALENLADFCEQVFVKPRENQELQDALAAISKATAPVKAGA